MKAIDLLGTSTVIWAENPSYPYGELLLSNEKPLPAQWLWTSGRASRGDIPPFDQTEGLCRHPVSWLGGYRDSLPSSKKVTRIGEIIFPEPSDGFNRFWLKFGEVDQGVTFLVRCCDPDSPEWQRFLSVVYTEYVTAEKWKHLTCAPAMPFSWGQRGHLESAIEVVKNVGTNEKLLDSLVRLLGNWEKRHLIGWAC